MSLLNDKYLFVHINKSGGGVITNTFALNGNTKLNDMHRSLKDMLKIAKEKYNIDRNKLFIITIVRNPYERMLSMYLFYHKNHFYSPEFFSGNSDIDNDFNSWIIYIYSENFNRNRVHGGVNIFKYCFCNQLNWIKDNNEDLIKIDKILRHEKNEYDELFGDIMKLSNYDTKKMIHSTKHTHYSDYYNDLSIKLVTQHYKEDIEYFKYKYINMNSIKSYSQCKQEKWVLNYFNNKKNGVFIELGALDGIRHSNTFLLENNYNWSGLMIEPSPSLYKELKINRNIHTENILVGDKKQENIDFLYIEDKTKCIGLQGVIENYNTKHFDRIIRELKSKPYEIIKMNMVTLQELCDKYNICKVDYLSLDVEGSELKVLEGIDFSKLDIELIGVEINYDEDKNKIYNILNKNGYTFIKRVGDHFFIKK
jgi:FkbM family methyltransferase